MSASDRLLQVLSPERPQVDPWTFRLATVPDDYTTGDPTVIFDGETDPTTRTYKVADHVTTLAAGKTVLVGLTKRSGVILAAWDR